jgi:beta-ribofuranosylaminobenzene 5'-phosphate synthase
MPENWVVTLAFHNSVPTIEPAEEQRFFERHTPTSKADSLNQLAHVFHGMLPALLERDLEQFGRSLRAFQSLGFKACEIAAQPALVRAVLNDLWQKQVAAGLSSLGPTVFAVHQRGTSIRNIIGTTRGVELGGPYEFRNIGHELQTSDG